MPFRLVAVLTRTHLMFQRILRARVQDAATDRSRVRLILGAIENALHEAEREHSGLSQRIEEVLERPAVTVGTAPTNNIWSGNRLIATIGTCSAPRSLTVNAGSKNSLPLLTF
jgi:hypothetical protein